MSRILAAAAARSADNDSQPQPETTNCDRSRPARSIPRRRRRSDHRLCAVADLAREFVKSGAERADVDGNLGAQRLEAQVALIGPSKRAAVGGSHLAAQQLTNEIHRFPCSFEIVGRVTSRPFDHRARMHSHADDQASARQLVEGCGIRRDLARICRIRIDGNPAQLNPAGHRGGRARQHPGVAHERVVGKPDGIRARLFSRDGELQQLARGP
jgi:hypothetical protein